MFVLNVEEWYTMPCQIGWLETELVKYDATFAKKKEIKYLHVG